MKIFIFTEDLSKPLEEGIKKVAFDIINDLSKVANVLVVCHVGQIFRENFINLKTNRLLINIRLQKIIKKFNPDIILYIPRWCGTFAGFVRMKILSIYNRRSKSLMIILQPKKIGRLQRKLIKFLKPDKAFSPSPMVIDQLTEYKIPIEFLPLTVDRNKFRSLSDFSKKKELRIKYGLPLKKFIILHVGHINSGRNLEALIPLQKNNNQVVIVGSSSTSDVAYKDEALKDLLKEKRIIIVDNYIEKIEEVYQLADVYVFPVIFEGGCIGIPLSILEARACGLPIISTDFGGIRKLFSSKLEGIIYAKTNDFPSLIKQIKLQKRLYPEKDFLDFTDRLFKRCLNNMINI